MKSSNADVKRRRTFVRLLGEIQHALHEALDEEFRGRGLTQSEMARNIGRSKSFVSRKMSGSSNMTIETLADLAFALDRPVRISLPSRQPAVGTNYFSQSPTTDQNSRVKSPAEPISTAPQSLSPAGDNRILVTAQ